MADFLGSLHEESLDRFIDLLADRLLVKLRDNPIPPASLPPRGNPEDRLLPLAQVREVLAAEGLGNWGSDESLSRWIRRRRCARWPINTGRKTANLAHVRAALTQPGAHDPAEPRSRITRKLDAAAAKRGPRRAAPKTT